MTARPPKKIGSTRSAHDQPSAEQTEAAPIYHVLADHQRAEPWTHRDLLSSLHQWAEHFDAEFKLDALPVSICVDRLSTKTFGHFRIGHNGFGLQHEIAINSVYLATRPFAGLLGTLLHELLHAWQQEHGTPSAPPHHNAEFRQKAETLGLIIDRRGVTTYAQESAFTRLLTAHGVGTDGLHVPATPKTGRSKLAKWTCACGINVRVARQDFYAQCLRCGQVFRAAQSGGSQ